MTGLRISHTPAPPVLWSICVTSTSPTSVNTTLSVRVADSRGGKLSNTHKLAQLKNFFQILQKLPIEISHQSGSFQLNLVPIVFHGVSDGGHCLKPSDMNIVKYIKKNIY